MLRWYFNEFSKLIQSQKKPSTSAGQTAPETVMQPLIVNNIIDQNLHNRVKQKRNI